ncbi:hypothetical protein [Paracoccus aminophilus]|uniref:D-galactarate dehydratase n=1 Tax=Paracoccus aminophilus JCM 7686 TaxID=1367847 RepID=S5YWL5_PARAH|nr:hypothetical protein [Paracoccus aminophilus]AGT09586.1 hypothetical protein JCM7686_2518 [Paracoccus aminophilus JCM 7686]
MPLPLRLALLLPLIGLTACTQINGLLGKEKPAGTSEAAAAAAPGDTATTATATAVTTTAPVPKASAKTAAQLDTTTAAQKVEAAKPAVAAEKKLGTTIASLGDPTVPGFWIKTPLVKAAAQGRIVNPANGKSSKVELLPLAGPAGGGSQVSLPALQLIGVSLTDLPSIEVYQN